MQHLRKWRYPHIQHTSLILHNQQTTQKVTLLTHMIIYETQSIAIKQHNDVCPKDPYWADQPLVGRPSPCAAEPNNLI